MNMMHNWGWPIDRRLGSPFPPPKPSNKLTTSFQARLDLTKGNIHRPPYVYEELLPLVDAAWFVENPVSAMRINHSARPGQRIQFFAGGAMLMRPSMAGLVLTAEGVDAIERASLVTPKEPVWGNLMRIARWFNANRISV